MRAMFKTSPYTSVDVKVKDLAALTLKDVNTLKNKLKQS